MLESAHLCECGCGRETPVFKVTQRYRGRVAGEHARFIRGHNGRGVERPKESVKDRLLSKILIDANGCWIWQGALFAKTGYLGLFTSQSASTVPAATAVLATPTGVTEASGTAYARQAIAAASWGAQAAGSPDGRKSTAGQVTMPTVGAGAWGTINGFFLATASTAGIAIYYANFDDVTAIVTAPGDVIRVTPFINFGA